MNIEVFSYSGMVAFLGISIVFLSLMGLCLLMVLLKAAFKEQDKPLAAIPVSPVVSAVPEEDTAWVIAAAVAFLMEAEDPGPSAARWAPASSEATDPWMNRTTFGDMV